MENINIKSEVEIAVETSKKFEEVLLGINNLENFMAEAKSHYPDYPISRMVLICDNIGHEVSPEFLRFLMDSTKTYINGK